MTNAERDWTPERHLNAIIREREYDTYDEEWDGEHVEHLVDEMISFFVEKTGIRPEHFRRDGLAAMAQTSIDSARNRIEKGAR